MNTTRNSRFATPRLAGLSLAFVLTLAMLAMLVGIDSLAQPSFDAAAQMAQQLQASVRA